MMSSITEYLFKVHKPSARQGKARLRGRGRIMYSKTIHPRLCEATPACAGESGLCIQRPYTLGYARRSPPAWARADYLFEDHQPAGGALLSVIVYRLFLSPTASSLIGYWLSAIGYRLSAIGYRLSCNADSMTHCCGAHRPAAL